VNKKEMKTYIIEEAEDLLIEKKEQEKEMNMSLS